MKLIFMGSAAFAVPSLDALTRGPHEILEVVTQPDKPAGRGMRTHACVVAEFARSRGISLYQPKSVKVPEAIEHIGQMKPDLIVVVAYGKILPKALLEIPPHGCVNVHASLLPRYRGAAPINWAIVNGESETGVTTQRIVEELDAGDILLSVKTKIDEAETADGLYDRLALMGADLLLETVDGIEKGTLKPIPQDPSQATFAPIIKKGDGHIDWSMSASSIYDRIRGFKPWPGSFSFLDGKQLKVIEAAPAEMPASDEPGTIVECDKHLAVACGDGVLYLLEVQPEGRKSMPASDFLRGHRVQRGAKLT